MDNAVFVVCWGRGHSRCDLRPAAVQRRPDNDHSGSFLKKKQRTMNLIENRVNSFTPYSVHLNVYKCPNLRCTTDLIKLTWRRITCDCSSTKLDARPSVWANCTTNKGKWGASLITETRSWFAENDHCGSVSSLCGSVISCLLILFCTVYLCDCMLRFSSQLERGGFRLGGSDANLTILALEMTSRSPSKGPRAWEHAHWSTSALERKWRPPLLT